MSKPRDVVVVRVSEKGDREDEHFHSPEVQIEAARRWARDRGERLVASAIPEIDVTGRMPLSKRPGLLAAIEMIEARQADQLVVAYFDRLVRSLKVQLEVIERVERAGGEIFALDHGKLTNGTAAQRLSTNMLGSVFQYFAEITGEKAHEAIVNDRGLFERVQHRTVSRGRQAKSERLLARLGVLRCGTCGSRMVINSDSGSYRCGDTSVNRCRRRAAVKADRVEEMVLEAVRAYSATADPHPRASRRRQIREADEAIERASAGLDDAIRQLGELGLLGRAASQKTLEKLAMTLDDAHAVRARLGDGARATSSVLTTSTSSANPRRLAAWRRLITDAVESVTVAPAMTADGCPSRLWDPRRIDIRFLGEDP